jgi:MFS family permease
VGPNFSTGQIMLFEVMRYLGVMAAAWIIRRRIDATGARPFFLLALFIYIVVGTFWWFYLENGFGGIPGILGAYFLLGLGAATWGIANLNYLPQIVTPEERTLAVSVHGAVTACIGGLSPVVWGIFLKSDDGPTRGINPEVFQWFFVTVVVGAIAISYRLVRLPEEKGLSVEPILIGNAILRPFRAVTYLVNLVEPRPMRKDKEQSVQKP